MQDIKGARGLDELLVLLEQSQPYLNLRHLDAALDRIAKLTLSTRDTAGSSSPWRSTSRIPPSTDSHLFSAGGCPANLSASQRAQARAAAARLLAAVLPAHSASLSPRDCASILGALSRLDLVPEPHLAALLQGRLLDQLRASSVRDRVQLLHASAKLGLGLPQRALPELLRSWDYGVLAETGKPQDVSMVLWALATLRRPPPPAWLRRLLAALQAGRLAAFPPQALANTAWALASLGFRPDPAWLRELVAASRPMMRVFSLQEQCNLVWALAVLRHRPPPPWLGDYMAQLRERAGSLGPQDLSNVCWSLAVLRVRPGLPLMHRLVARALAIRRDLTPQALILTLWGLSRLRVQLPERVVTLLLQGGLNAAVLAGTGTGTGAEELEPHADPDPGAGGSRSGDSRGGRELMGSGGGQAVGREGAAAARAIGGGGKRDSGRAGRSGGGDKSGTRSEVVAAHRPAGPGELAGAALVLARCRHLPPRRWLVRYLGAVARELGHFGPGEITTLMYGLGGLAALGWRPEPRWMDLLLVQVGRLAAGQEEGEAGGAELPALLLPPPALQAPALPAPADDASGPGVPFGWPRLPDSRPGSAKQWPNGPAPLHELLGLEAQGPLPDGARLQHTAVPTSATATGNLALQGGQPGAEPLDAGPYGGDPAPTTATPGPAAALDGRLDRGPRNSDVGGAAGDGAAGQRAARLDPHQLTLALWAVAQLGHEPTEAWVGAVARAVGTRVQEFGPKDAATCMQALHQLAAAAVARSARHRRTLPGPPPTPVALRLRSGAREANGGREGSRSRRSGSSPAPPPGVVSSVAALATRLAGGLPEHSLYRALHVEALARGGMSYATWADQLLAESYGFNSLGLLRAERRVGDWGM